MKKLVITAILCSLAITLSAQFARDAARVAPAAVNATLSSHSGQILEVLKTEIKRREQAHFKLSNDDKQKLLAFMADSVARSQFLTEMNYRIRQLKDTSIDQSYIKDKLQELDKTISPVAKELQQTFRENSLGEFWNIVLAPVLSEGVDNYARAFADDFYKTNINQLKTLADQLIKAARREGIELYAVELAKVKEAAAKFIKNKNIIIGNELLAEKLIDQVRKNIIAQAARTGTARISNVQQALTAESDKITKALSAHFKDLGDSFQKLYNNELAVDATIKAWGKDIDTRVQEINRLENDIKDLIHANPPVASEPYNKLKEYQANHAKLVAQNISQLKIVSDYLKNGLAVVERLPEYKAKLENLFAAGSTIFQDLDKLKTPTLSAVLTYGSNAAQTAGGVAAGVLHLIGADAAAQKVGTFVKYAVGGFQLLTSLFPPNPIGIISGLASLFGGGGPDPQQQMMQQMMDQMQKGFDGIHTHLDEIETKIDSLNALVTRFYRDTMKSFQVIMKELAAIEIQLNTIQSMVNYDLYSDYKDVVGFFDGINSNPDFNDRYLHNGIAGYREMLTSILVAKDHLKTLYNIVVSKPEGDFRAFTSDIQFLQPDSEITKRRKAEFEASRTLFAKYYPFYTSRPDVVNLVMLPPEQVDTGYSLEVRRIVTTAFSYKMDFSLATRYNDEILSSISKNFISVIPIYIMYTNQHMDMPADVEEFLGQYTDYKYEMVAKGLAKLLRTVNAGIFQEITMSGHPYLNQTYSTLFATDAYATEAIAALRVNSTLSRNMVTYTLNGLMGNDSSKMARFNRDYYAYLTNFSVPDSTVAIIGRLNSLLPQTGKAIAFKASDDANDKNLYFEYKHSDKADDVWTGLVPDAQIILDRQMVYNSSYYVLAQTKDKLLAALFDLRFPKILTTDNMKTLDALIRYASTD